MILDDLLKSLLIIIISFTISAVSTPIVKKIAFKIGALDIPDGNRKIHKVVTPRLGGLAIYISFILNILIFMHLNKDILGIIGGASIIVIGGILDDCKGLKPYQKILFQFAAIIVLISFNVSIKNISSSLFTTNNFVPVRYMGILITFLWVLGITNAMNLIDGLDGLASGICIIGSISLFIICVINGRFLSATLILILIGSILGFIPFNFNPASIFLGDTGSQFLGFILASISIQGAVKSATTIVLLIPIMILGVPIYDTLSTIIRRIVHKQPIMSADKEHLHHRLLKLGLTQKQVVLIMYIISIILNIGALIITLFPTKIVAFLALLILICMCAIEFHYNTHKY